MLCETAGMHRTDVATPEDMLACREAVIRLDERIRCAAIGVGFFGGVLIALEITIYVMVRGL
jgi:hypothetical protein